MFLLLAWKNAGESTGEGASRKLAQDACDGTGVDARNDVLKISSANLRQDNVRDASWQIADKRLNDVDESNHRRWAGEQAVKSDGAAGSSGLGSAFLAGKLNETAIGENVDDSGEVWGVEEEDGALQGGDVGETSERAKSTWVQAAKGVQNCENGVDLSCERSVGKDVGEWCKSCSLDAVDDIWEVVWDWDNLSLCECVSTT